MNAFGTLEHNVANSSLRVIQAIGIPRSMSTALGRALNESGVTSVFVNEPFNRDNQDIDVTACHILEASSTLIKPGESSVTVITKNMASYVSPDVYREMVSISDATIWTVRNPLVQIGSLLTRIVNDMFAEPGADIIRQEEIGPYLKDACEFLEDSQKSQNFSKTGWTSIGGHYRSTDQPERTIVVDGGEFTENPEQVLGDVCKKIDLPFSLRMLEGWQNDFINVVNNDAEQETARSAWTKHAATSLGIVAVSRSALNLSELPSNLRHHINEVAVPTYQEMTGLYGQCQ